MTPTLWFESSVIILGLFILSVCTTTLYVVLKQSKGEQLLSKQVISLLAQMSEQQVHITERHKHMTDILVTMSNELLKAKQKV